MTDHLIPYMVLCECKPTFRQILPITANRSLSGLLWTHTNRSKLGDKQHILLCNITTTFFFEKVAIITQIWHRAQSDFTSISITWYLITVLNTYMNKIALFFFQISHHWTNSKFMKKNPIITQIWKSAKFYSTYISSL